MGWFILGFFLGLFVPISAVSYHEYRTDKELEKLKDK